MEETIRKVYESQFSVMQPKSHSFIKFGVNAEEPRALG